ncbi:Polyketide cyclase/dehydrase [Corchorus capsularis]|uniref:Polyketide cyclase/dehydrase n=1 Tax=Corchorus capsularis TaxID=210143 RepID=A0A1R3I0V0_COCAP|nr:Polyketide cyclase/dehydrase [Corchorus capsularis]
MMKQFHTPNLSSNQCGSSLVQTIDAPLSLVWSIIRRFEHPQAYKQFVKSCSLSFGDGDIGSVREVMHRLVNYRSTVTLHEIDEEEVSGGGKTVVVESYVVDVPDGSSKEDTCSFADMIIGCNLRSLARVTEKMAKL